MTVRVLPTRMRLKFFKSEEGMIRCLISQSIHGENAHIHRIPLPDMSKLCHCILCVCVESSSPRSDQKTGHLDLWLLLSQGGIEKCGDRRVVESQELIPISLEATKCWNFWVFFCFLVRSAWKRMQRLYSLVIIHHSDGKSTLWRCGLWISIVCKTGCLWWWAVTWFSPQRWGWLKRGSTSVITPIGIHPDEVYFAKKQTRRPPQFFPCFHRTFGNHVLYRLLSYLKCDRSKSSRWSLMHLNQMEEAAYSTDANGVFYVIINKNKEETKRPLFAKELKW